jgi:hypothetical protein
MKNDTCTVCGKKFEPRQGKLYCSESCKQAAFNERKKIPKDFEEGEILSHEIKKKVLYQFEKEEYLKVEEAYGDKLNIIEYCFMRKNLIGNPTVKEIVEYIKNFGFEFTDPEKPDYKPYCEFLQEYQRGQINIHYNNPKTEESPTIETTTEKTES